MKAKDLAKILLENPEYDVVFTGFVDDDYGRNRLVLFDVNVDDIGHSSCLIKLGGDEQ